MSSANDGHVDATFYIQVEPEFRPYADHNGEPVVRAAKAVRLTKTRPVNPVSGTLTAKLTLRFPKRAFLPLQPEAVIEIPESMAAANPIEVIVEEPAA